MSLGYNKADEIEKAFSHLASLFKEEERPCVFLSHKKEDKVKCRKIAEYLSKAEIDYYLDEKDQALQNSILSEDPILITESIKTGIRESTHMLVVVSKHTYKSQWVPFEVGYGHASIIDHAFKKGDGNNSLKLSILTLKDISEEVLPTFMQVGNIIRGTKSFNEYIAQISNKVEKSLMQEEKLFSNNQMNHPLDDVLNWQK